MKWSEIGFVAKSKNRQKVLELLLEKPQNPSNIAKAMNNHRSSISKIVNELVGKGLVESLTPDDPTFRLYKITTKGKETLKEAKK